ncbi:hypothetical protein HC776_00805, partial [bacterium]|nr:hypothetical protein [bacterium]
MGLRTVLSWRPWAIGQKTAGGYRKNLAATPDLRLQLDGQRIAEKRRRAVAQMKRIEPVPQCGSSMTGSATS